MRSKTLLLFGIAMLCQVLLACSANGEENEVRAKNAQPASTAKSATRQEFARAMAKIQEGMAEEQVTALLGKPDDVRTEYDPGGISTNHTKEIWVYGTDGHFTFGTRGSVYIDTGGKVQYVFGGRGDPPSPSMFSEAELRSLLRLLAKAPSCNAGSTYDPLAVIRIVNALQPLGKEKALAAINEFLRVSSDFDSRARDGMFLVLRVLFDVPAEPGYMPPMLVGAPWPSEPAQPKLSPRFPIVLMDDIPLLLVSGYSLAGCPEPPEDHVDYFRKNGTVRAKPLLPGNVPLQLYQSCVEANAWMEDANLKDRKELVANQLLALVDTVYRTKKARGRYRFDFTSDMDVRWKAIAEQVAKLDVRWNATKCCYTFKDGTCLPESVQVIYQRKIWKPEGLPGSVSVILERQDTSQVSVGLVWSAKLDEKKPACSVEVLAAGNQWRPIMKEGRSSVEFSDSFERFSSQWCEVNAEEGSDLKVRLKLDKHELYSPVLRP